jgi:hypothetical protein
MYRRGQPGAAPRATATETHLPARRAALTFASMGDETTNASGCAQRAYLYLERDHDLVGPPFNDDDLAQLEFDPDEVTALVGLTPTTTWRRGDPASWRGGRPHRFSGWKYELPEISTFDTEEVVIALLDVIEPHGEKIVSASHTWGMRAGVMVVIWMYGELNTDGEMVVSTPALGYTAPTVQRLARLGLAVHHDQYVALP